MIGIKVIYTDGTSEKIRALTLEVVKKTGKIIAFHCSEGWIEVRRKGKSTFNGVDRRKTTPEKFFAGFDT